ncbi:DUF2325 domain-containing protein [Pelotomaculum propionicicum]|uniref:DUF2325 domain-containing protein n=1 Tax=Pelotomaculum propionicicum TaxID=258475 RepID=UPI003B7A784A
MLVGADRIGTKEQTIIKRFGMRSLTHWAGREKKFKTIPASVGLIIVLTQFVNHGLMYHVKKEAKKFNIRVIYLKRGITELTA